MSRHTDQRFQRWLWVLIGTFIVLFTAYSMVINSVFHSHSSDTGNMWQTIWNTAHGHGFTFTHPGTGETGPRLGTHADYFLIVFAPAAWLGLGPASLYAAQALGVGLGAWCVWSIIRALTGSVRLSFAWAVAYLAYGPLQFALLWQFHSLTFAPALVLAAIEAIVSRRRRWLVWLWFGLALATKEQVGFIAGPLLGWWIWTQGRRRFGVAVATIGIVYAALHFFFLIPSARPDGQHFVWNFYYGDIAAEPGEQLRGLLSPGVLGDRLFTVTNGHTLISLLLPLAGLSLVSPMVVLTAPALLPHFLAQVEIAGSPYHVGHLLGLVVTLVAAMAGTAWLWRRRPVWRPRLVGWLIGWTAVGSFIISPMPWSLAFQPGYLERDRDLERLAALAEIIPSTASVAYSRETGPWFRSHRVTYPLLLGLTRADYVVVFEPVLYGGQRNDTFLIYQPIRDYLESSQGFALIAQTSRGRIYQRTASTLPPLPAGLRKNELSV